VNPLDYGSFVMTVEMVAGTLIAFMGAGLVAAALAVAVSGRR
jgi:hypothetical protein